MSELQIIDKWVQIMLRTIRDAGLGPTYTARFQYLVSTILYYSFVCYSKATSSCLIEPELQIIQLQEQNIAYLDNIICVSMRYLYDLLGYDKKEISTNTEAMNNKTKSVVDKLKLFLDRRNEDGWKIANVQPLFPNGQEFIDVENIQDLNALLVDKTKWTPLKHKNANPQKYLTPEWGNVQTLENFDIAKFIAVADENFVQSQRQYEINEVLKEYDNLNDFKRMIAEFFQGGQVTPPGIWNVYALYMIRTNSLNALDATKFLYLLNSTMFMGSVVAWNVKRKYMQARPIQEIRLLPEQQVTNFDGNKISNKAWKTFQQQNFQTPPFPDYISGHSTFSSGAACIFEKFFPINFNTSNFLVFENEHATMITPMLENNNYPNTIKAIMIKNSDSKVIHDTTNMKFPTCAVKLEFDSWRQLAYYSGVSRIYGGIHGNNANNAGLIIGEMIAKDILNRAL